MPTYPRRRIEQRSESRKKTRAPQGGGVTFSARMYINKRERKYIARERGWINMFGRINPRALLWEDSYLRQLKSAVSIYTRIRGGLILPARLIYNLNTHKIHTPFSHNTSIYKHRPPPQGSTHEKRKTHLSPVQRACWPR